MKLISFIWKQIIPILVLILYPTIVFSDLPTGDLILSEVEVIQVVPGPKGVIAGKPAALKLTIESSFDVRKRIEIRVNYNASDTYSDAGSGLGIPIAPGTNTVYLPGGPAFPTSPEPWIDEGKGPHLIWDLGASGDLVLVTIDADNAVAETDEENNRIFFFVDVFHPDPYRVLIVPIALALQEDWELDASLIERQKKFMEETYPIADLRFRYRELWRLNSVHLSGGLIDEDWFYNDVVLPISTEADLLGYDRVVIAHTNALWPLGFCGSAMGMLREPQNRLPVVIVSEDHGELNYCLNKEKLIAHEIGHTYFLWHPFSDLFPLPVFDSLQNSVTQRNYEVETKTFMDYEPCCLKYAPDCTWNDPLCELPVPWWIDDERYQSFPKTWVDTSSEYPISGTYMWNLLDQLVEIPNRMPVLAVRGTIFKDEDKAMLAYSYLFLGRPHITPQEPPQGPFNYQIILLGSQNESLAAYPFNVSFKYALELDFSGELKIFETDAIPFQINVPYVEGTAFIEVEDPSGMILGSIAVTPNAPEVTMLYPNGGEFISVGSEIKSCWHGQDQDGDNLRYLLAYSDNGGEEWIPIASKLTETCHAWETKNLPPGNQYLIKVIATDGVNTKEDESNETFSLIAPMSVRRAKVVKQPARSKLGTVSLWADFNAPALGDSDIIAAYFDGNKLFAAPFGAFHRGLRANVYLLIERKLLVRIDLNNNSIYVRRHKADLSGFKPSNGVDVELGLGDAVAVETIAMESQSRRVWVYRPGNE